MTSSGSSSKVIRTPGSLNSVAPRTRNSTPNMLLPHPALPQTSVGRPFGKPPSVISSNPSMPVGDLGNNRLLLKAFFLVIAWFQIEDKLATKLENYHRGFDGELAP